MTFVYNSKEMEYKWARQFTIDGEDKIVYVYMDTDMIWAMAQDEFPNIKQRALEPSELTKIVDYAFGQTESEILEFFQNNPSQSTYELFIQGDDLLRFLVFEKLFISCFHTP